ncbi:MAG: hypothetical protein JWP91_2190 [Fibrobacteres bacterium]|nr:hypothetical protein [Fibrobacterota bacterium]
MRPSRTPKTHSRVERSSRRNPPIPALRPPQKPSNKKGAPFEGAFETTINEFAYLPFGIWETICKFTSMPSTWKWGLTAMVTR